MQICAWTPQIISRVRGRGIVVYRELLAAARSLLNAVRLSLELCNLKELPFPVSVEVVAAVAGLGCKIVVGEEEGLHSVGCGCLLSFVCIGTVSKKCRGVSGPILQPFQEALVLCSCHRVSGLEQGLLLLNLKKHQKAIFSFFLG